MTNQKKIRLGIIGVGNCASSLVQGIEYYKNAKSNSPIPGIMNTKLGGYEIGDIEVVSAFDVSANKVGKDLSEAIKAKPNNTLCFQEIKQTGVIVSSGPLLDGIGQWLKDDVPITEEPQADVVEKLKATKTDLVVIYLPVGSEQAARAYINAALEAGCGVVNCIPVFVASDEAWVDRFKAAGLPIIGDDIKSQVGATIVHRVLANLMEQRGVRIDRTYQLNFGGNADFKNMLEHERLKSKKISKTQAVTSQINSPMDASNIHVGPSDHVPWLLDRKWAQIRLEGTGFGDTPINIELKLEVWDSPNSAGVVIDAVRCIKLALDRGIAGALEGPSSYFMKSPPRQFEDSEARKFTQQFIQDGT